jgi:predicted DNA binding CopG/RHH family protein
MRTRKPIPRFASEEAERSFWARHDSTEYIDWSRGERVVFPNLKSRAKTISIRLPASMIAALRALANRRDVPYQSLMKVFLADRIASEYRIPANTSLHVRERRPAAWRRG